MSEHLDERLQMKFTELDCPRCNTKNLVAECSNCGRHFVLVDCHLKDTVRGNNSRPVQRSLIPENYSRCCDYCIQKEGKQLARAIFAGLIQTTCPVCNTEFLRHHGL